MKIPDDVPIENKRVTGAIASAQSQVEAQNFDTRKNILKYDDVMSRQRTVIYQERRRVLEGADLHEQVRGFLDDTVEGYVTGATEGFPEEWDLDKLFTALKTLYPVSVTKADVEITVRTERQVSAVVIGEGLRDDACPTQAQIEPAGGVGGQQIRGSPEPCDDGVSVPVREVHEESAA